MLEASIMETAYKGVDVHILQPGLGWIPWWKSKVYPADEHYKWFKKRTGLEPDSFGQYMLDGGDMVKVFIETCRNVGLTPFISLRLNDAHHLQNAGMKNNGSIWVSRFYEEHPEFRIGTEIKSRGEHVQNWAIPEVRAHKLAFIQELCEQYDIDGLELDFMRYPRYFQLEKTTSKQRTEIMCEFVSEVRKILNISAKPRQHRWLCVRVPCHLVAHDQLGINLPKLVSSGVEMVNLSPHYCTKQQTDLAEIRKLVPNAALYLELTHCTSIGRKVNNSGGDNFTFCRTTDEQFYTAAHLAYARGADGISTFNFVYYREHGGIGRGPFNEPPFHVLGHLGEPAWLAKQPQNYILGNVKGFPHVPDRQIPKTIQLGGKESIWFDMAPPVGGWKGEGRLLVLGSGPFDETMWTARLNGVELKSTKDMPEPYFTNPYVSCSESKRDSLVWSVPSNLLIDGENEIEISSQNGFASFFKQLVSNPQPLVFIDISVQK
jgi:hypothetical protein